MTIPLLEILIALMLGYCAIICVSLTGALTGKNTPGTHCSGSLVALIAGIFTYFFTAALGGALSGILGASILGRLFGGGGGTATTGGGASETPSEGGSTSGGSPEGPAGPGEPGAPATPPEIPGMIGELGYIQTQQGAVAAV